MARGVLSSSEVGFVHSSDLHIGDVETTRAFDGDRLGPLVLVLAAARAARADAVLLAGDIFENNRVPRELAQAVADRLAAADIPVVVLPGNHDPLIEDGVWRLPAFAACGNVHVLGPGRRRSVRIERLALQVWGNAHVDYDDMAPLRAPVRRTLPFQVALAHGHYEPAPNRRKVPRPAWLIGEAEIRATDADYVALGHWNRATAVGDGVVAAHYSGAPELMRQVNLVTLRKGRVPDIRPLPFA
jgi:DNA repair exonuclease SbcCD nuclease subunit